MPAVVWGVHGQAFHFLKLHLHFTLFSLFPFRLKIRSDLLEQDACEAYSRVGQGVPCPENLLGFKQLYSQIFPFLPFDSLPPCLPPPPPAFATTSLFSVSVSLWAGGSFTFVFLSHI